MTSILAGALLFLGLQAAPAPADPYAAVLREMRGQFPEREVVLTTTLARPACAPHCDERDAAAVHPEDLIGALREMRLIVGTCTPEPRTVGCGAGREVWAPDRMVVTFGPVAWGEDAAEVTAVVHWREEYRGRGIDSVRGYRYRLVPAEGGGWRVVSSTLEWMA